MWIRLALEIISNESDIVVENLSIDENKIEVEGVGDIIDVVSLIIKFENCIWIKNAHMDINGSEFNLIIELDNEIEEDLEEL